MVAPEVGNAGIDAPILKYGKASARRGGLRVGLQYDAKVYRIFALAILQFYVQFHRATDDAGKAEDEAVKNLSRGPGIWAPEELLMALKSELGA
eukprot:4135318-Lingulodinium_polyedra.AAC.1